MTLIVTYMIFPLTVYVLLTLCTEILTAVIAEAGRRTVPGYSTVPMTLTTLLIDSLHSAATLEIFQFPLHKVTRQTQPALVIADLSMGSDSP